MIYRLNIALTDELDRLAVSAAEDENDGVHVDDGCHYGGGSPIAMAGGGASSPAGGDATNNNNNKGVAALSTKTGSTAGIDALLDSDEDGAEIFNDCESDEDQGNVSMVSESSHLSAAQIEKALSPSHLDEVLRTVSVSSPIKQC